MSCVGRPGDRGHLCPVRSLTVSGVHRRPTRPIARTHRTRLAGGGPAERLAAALHHHSDDRGRMVAAHVAIVGVRPLGLRDLRPTGPLRVVTRGSVPTENAGGGFGTAYRALSLLEEQASVAADTSSKAWVRPSSP